MLVRISGVITILIGAWVVLGMAFAPEPGAYVQILLALVVANLGLLGFRAWVRR